MGSKTDVLESIKEIARPIRIRLGYLLWVVRGRPTGGIYSKQQEVIRIGSRYGCATFVETGTGWGIMIEAVRRRFVSVFSVEVHRPLFERAKKKFKTWSNVFLFYGDSQSVLPAILSHTEGRILFWLDSHYSGPSTGGADTDCPLLMELETIAAHPRKDHCILIDDARLFGVDKEYPTLEEVTKGLGRINRDYRIEVQGDIIRALPPA